jgi:WD40 repeat protein
MRQLAPSLLAIPFLLSAGCAAHPAAPSPVAPAAVAPPPTVVVAVDAAPPTPPPSPDDLTLPSPVSTLLRLREVVGGYGVYHRWAGYLAFLPGGRLLTGTGSATGLRLWRLADERLLAEHAHPPEQRGHTPHRWVVSPDGQWLARTFEADRIEIVEVESGRVVRSLEHPVWTLELAWAGSRRLLVLEGDERGKERHIVALDPVRGESLARLDLPGALALSTSRDGARVAVSSNGEVRVLPSSLSDQALWSTARFRICDDDGDATPQTLWSLNHRCRPRLLWNGDGTRLIELAGTRVTVFDGSTGRVLWEAHRRAFADTVLDGALSVDGKLAVRFEHGGCLIPEFRRILDGSANRAVACNNLDDFSQAEFSLDGKYFAAIKNGVFTLRDAESAERVHVSGTHRGPVRHLAIDGAGGRVLSGGDDGSVRLWEGKREQRRWGIATSFLAFLPDGTRFVTTAWDPSKYPADAIFIDLATGAEVLRIPKVRHLALSDDGAWLADLTGYPTGLCLYDTSHGERRWCRAPEQVSGAGALAFLPKGAGVVASDVHYNLHIWDLRNGASKRLIGESYTDVFLPVGPKPTTAVVNVSGSEPSGRLVSLAAHAGRPSEKPAFPKPVAVSPDGEYLLANDRGFGILLLVRMRDATVIERVDLCESDDLMLTAIWSADGQRVLAGTRRGLVLDFDFDRAQAATAPAISEADGKRMFECHRFAM